MGSQLFLLSLLLITCIQQVQGNQKTQDTSLKLSKNGYDTEKAVISGDLGTITNVPGRLCKCEENGRWEENGLCVCAKSARRKNGRAKIRKPCQKAQKNTKKCHFPKKKQRKYGPIVPI